MTKEKIKELLLSRDRELRLLGLSYLNEDKNSSKVGLYASPLLSKLHKPYFEVSTVFEKDNIFVTFDIIYKYICRGDITSSMYLTPYINYCYK